MTTITSSSSEIDVSRWLGENKFTEYIQYVLCNWNGKAMLAVKFEILEKMIGVEGLRVYTLLHADLESTLYFKPFLVCSCQSLFTEIG